MPNEFETARSQLGATLQVRVPLEPDFRNCVFELRMELDRQGASISTDTLNAILVLAADLSPDLQDGLDDALKLLSRGPAVDVWPHLTPEVQKTLETLSGGKPLDFLAKLMVDFAVQWSV